MRVEERGEKREESPAGVGPGVPSPAPPASLHKPVAASSGRSSRRIERFIVSLWSWSLRRPWMYRLGSRLARWTLRPLARDGWIRRLPPPVSAWTANRDFPAPAAQSFRDWWESEGKRARE
jgi:L-lactate utilization protein LutB